MAKPMTKSQIITALAEANDMTKVQARDFLESLANLAYQGAKDGFTIPGVGTSTLSARGSGCTISGEAVS